MPWNVQIRGYWIPMTAVLGAIGTFAAWISVVVLHAEARAVGIPWMVLGLVGFVVYRRRSGLDLTSPAKIDRGQPPENFVPLGYGSARVPIFGADVSGRALRAASKFVADGATIDAVYLVTVPAQLPLDGPLGDEEEHGRSVLEAAHLVGRRNGLDVRTRLLRTRNPGRTLVEEAERLHSEIIYLAAAHAPPSERALGPTATYLLSQRPCRVIVSTSPNQ
jgi:APA family basic amino acid/polyamine antiporter